MIINTEQNKNKIPERRAIRLKITRNDLLGVLDLPEGQQLVQINVGDDGEICLLIEGGDLPIIGSRGRAADYYLKDRNSLFRAAIGDHVE